MASKKQKWFDIPDSLTQEEQGNRLIEYYNVEAYFFDHQVIDLAASQEARFNQYQLVPAMMMRIKRAALGQPAVKNGTTIVLRFDKGRHLPRPDFEACKATIERCWEAWEAYQKARKAPVTHEEEIALGLINRGPRLPVALKKLKPPRSIIIEDEDEDGETPPEPVQSHGEYLASLGAGPEAGSSGESGAPASRAPAKVKAASAPAKAAKTATKKPPAKKKAA